MRSLARPLWTGFRLWLTGYDGGASPLLDKMATLIAEFEKAYSLQYRVGLVFPDDETKTSTTGSEANLASASDAVLGDFISVLGKAYAEADKSHISVGVEGVEAKLVRRAGRVAGSQMEDAYLERLRGLRSRALPVTSSRLTPSPEVSTAGRVARPVFDDARFAGVLPSEPRG